ncbi:hypothetical protein Hte_006985 [Hypoxylon texense]
MIIASNSTVALASLILGATLLMVDFSYDAGMINQLLLSENFFEYFELNSTWIDLNVAIVNIGNLVASPIVGLLMDAVGREKAIWFSNLIAIIGVVIQAAAKNSGLFLLLALESPRWLLFKNRPEEARQVLETTSSSPPGHDRDAVILAEYDEMAQVIEYKSQTDESVKTLVEKPSDRQTYTLLYLNLGLTAWGVVSLASGLWITHRFGSKTIMIANTTVMTICLALLAIFAGVGFDNGKDTGALVATFIFWWASCSC